MDKARNSRLSNIEISPEEEQVKQTKMSLDQNPEDPKIEKSEEIAEVDMTPKETETETEEKESSEVVKKEGSEAEEDPASGSFFRIDSGLLPFPEKLMALLDGDQVADAMWWLPDGDAFCLIPVVFAEKVLDKHFQGTKFESFTRKLNRWGFKRVAGQKVPTNTIAYYNKNFLRGKPKLLKNMNGGKTKFISAREKRVRAQMKRERDREQAVLIAAQQQALYAEQMGIGSRGASMLAQAKASLGNQNHMRLQNLLVSRPLAMQQAQANERLMAEQMMAAEHAMVQQQREELQMRLLRAGMGGFPSMQDPRDLGSSNQLFSSVNQAQLAGFQSQLRRGSGEQGGQGGGGDVATEQLLLARQMAAASDSNNQGNNMMAQHQRMMMQQMNSSNAGGTSGFNNPADDAAAKIVRQRMDEEQLLKSKAFMAQQTQSQQQQHGKSIGSPSQAPQDGGQLDPQLFQIYLLEQQRKREMSNINSNAPRQA